MFDLENSTVLQAMIIYNLIAVCDTTSKATNSGNVLAIQYTLTVDQANTSDILCKLVISDYFLNFMDGIIISSSSIYFLGHPLKCFHLFNK